MSEHAGGGDNPPVKWWRESGQEPGLETTDVAAPDNHPAIAGDRIPTVNTEPPILAYLWKEPDARGASPPGYHPLPRDKGTGKPGNYPNLKAIEIFAGKTITGTPGS